MDDTTVNRQSNNKELLLIQLSKNPIVQVACEKAGVSRTSYYRWRQEDKIFAHKADLAISESVMLMNEVAESQLLSLIKDRNPTAIFYWLNHRHPAYAQRIEISASNAKDGITEEEINHLTQLLYSKNTFKQGQSLLTSYVFKGYISEKFAQLILKMFMTQLRAEDVMTRKAEAEILTEVMTRRIQYKEKKKLKYGSK